MAADQEWHYSPAPGKGEPHGSSDQAVEPARWAHEYAKFSQQSPKQMRHSIHVCGVQAGNEAQASASSFHLLLSRPLNAHSTCSQVYTYLYQIF